MYARLWCLCPSVVCIFRKMKKTFEAFETVGEIRGVLQILTRRFIQIIWFQSKFVVTLHCEKQPAARYQLARTKTDFRGAKIVLGGSCSTHTKTN